MNIGQGLAFVALSLLKGSNKTLHWSTVQQWISQNANPRNIGKGYASFNPRTGIVQGGYVELRRDSMGSTGVRLSAAVYFDKHQGPSTTKTWEASKLDSELEKMFGKNLRTRIQI